MPSKILKAILGISIGFFPCLMVLLAVLYGQHFFTQNKTFGAGYSPVTGFQTLTTSRVSASATTIPVASVSDKSGLPINISQISSSSTVRMYFNFEPGTTREEPFYCTGISSLNLTGCVRGISFQGSDLTSSSTIAQIHNAGAAVIMTNLGVMYGNEFVAISGTQTIFDVKSFNSFPSTTNTAALPVSAGQFATKGYVDSVGAGGFTAANVSTTLGMLAISSGVPNCTTAAACVGFNASSTGGLSFTATTGSVFVAVSSTASTGGGYMKINQILNLLFWDAASFLSGANTWSGIQTMTNELILPLPTKPNDAVPYDYSVSSYATGTAGMSLLTGRAVFFSATSSQLIYTNSANASSTFLFVGIMGNQNFASGQTAIYTRPGGINCNQSGLTAGYNYYLNGASGNISATPDTTIVSAMIGRAFSTTCLEVIQPRFVGTKGGSFTLASNGTASTITTGFNPTRVDLQCAGDSGSIGWWTLNMDNTTSAGSVGQNGASVADTTAFLGGAFSCDWNVGGSSNYHLVVTTSTGGFTVTNSSGFGSSNATVLWTASTDGLHFP